MKYGYHKNFGINFSGIENSTRKEAESVKPERQIPIGNAADLEKTKEVLPAVEVKNHVIWVNPNFSEAPFSLQEGRQTNLGLFLTSNAGDKNSYPIEIEKQHRRSGMIGRVIFKDSDRNVYRDVDLKGGGHIETPVQGKLSRVGAIRWSEEASKGVLGIMNLAAAYHDKDMSEEFIAKGIDTHRVLGIIALDEIVIQNGEIISIDEAKRQNFLPDAIRPVIEVRAFGIKTRFSEIGVDNPKSQKYIEDAKKFISQKEGINFENDKDYLIWLAKKVGKNLGLMQKNDFCHKYLIFGHNITLDGCLVDLDSVEKVNDQNRQKLFDDDFKAATQALMNLSEFFKTHLDSKILQTFQESYEQAKQI